MRPIPVFGTSVLLTQKESLAPLLKVPGVRCHELQESFAPRRPSLAPHAAARAMTPAVVSRQSQWVIQAPAAAFCWLSQGLLRWRRQFLYEANPLNAGTGVELSLNPWSMASQWLRRGWNPAAVPPGWWRPQSLPTLTHRSLVLLSSHNNPNYHHWCTQPGLSPLMLMEHFGLDTGPDGALALSTPRQRPLPAFVEPLLELAAPGVPRLHGQAFRPTQATFSLHHHQSDVVVSPTLMHWWRRRLDEARLLTGAPRRRWLLSRRRASTRRCLNESKLFASLQPLGFELVELEDLSVAKQFQLFASSSVVVAVHGAGLTNLIAAPTGSTIVELLPDDGPYNHYYLMAEVLGLRHGHVIGKGRDPRTDDFWVEPDQVLDLLQALGVAGTP